MDVPVRMMQEALVHIPGGQQEEHNMHTQVVQIVDAPAPMTQEVHVHIQAAAAGKSLQDVGTAATDSAGAAGGLPSIVAKAAGRAAGLAAAAAEKITNRGRVRGGKRDAARRRLARDRGQNSWGGRRGCGCGGR